MKFLYVGVTLVGIAFVFGCSSRDEAGQSIAGERERRVVDAAEIEKMNAIQGDVEYHTYCLKGKRVIYSAPSIFYELDDLGHPIPCNTN